MNQILAVAMPSLLTAIGCSVEVWAHNHYAPTTPPTEPTDEQEHDHE